MIIVQFPKGAGIFLFASIFRPSVGPTKCHTMGTGISLPKGKVARE